MKQLLSLLTFLLILSSCSQEELKLKEIEDQSFSGDQKIVDDKLAFASKKALEDFINEKSEDEFIKDAKMLRKRGFKPLAPIFTEDETKKKKEFLLRKKKNLLSKSSLYTSKNYEGADLDVDDEIIFDPRFAALLNENREIIVDGYLYVYTTKGLFYSKVEHEEKLRTFLQSLETKMVQNKYLQPLEPCSAIETSQDVYFYSDCGGGGSGGGGGYTGGTPSNNYDDFPLDIKRSLGVCTVDDDSLWQQVFGEAETCHDYFADDRRAKTKFWNQNYLIFSSIGVAVKHQKRNWGIWDSSNATDYIEMGLTNVSFKYNFNTPVYDDIFWNIQSEVIIEHKGKTYTADGRVIHGYPLQSSHLPLDASDNQSLTIYLFNRDIEIINEQQANDMIRDIARDFISDWGSSLETPLDNDSDDLGIKGVVIDPLAGNVTYTIVGRVERKYNASSITKILDFNVLVGTTLKLSGGSYSVGDNGPVYNSGANTTYDFFGATSYTDVTLDMYGVVRRGGDQYRGKRVISENLD